MENRNGEIHIEDDEATGAVKTGAMRWVLGISLLLAVVAMSAVWIIPAMLQGDVEEEATVSGAMQSSADEGDSTDSVILEDVGAADDIDDRSGPGMIATETAS